MTTRLDPLLEGIQADREMRLRNMRRAGIQAIDRWGRPRVDVTGNSSQEAAIARAIQPVQNSKALPDTTGFSPARFTELYRAVARANLQGLLLNSFITVSWSTVGITRDDEINAAHKWLVRRLREWCTARRDPIPYALVWVKEHSARLGTHSHILMHVERWQRARLGYTVKKFVQKFAGRPVLAAQRMDDGRVLSTIYVDGPNSRFETTKSQIEFQWHVFRYLMKGATAKEWMTVVGPGRAKVLFRDHAQLSVRDQGPVKGKRTGISTSLGEAAWRDFAERHELPDDWFDFLMKRTGIVYGDEFLRESELLRSMKSIRDRW